MFEVIFSGKASRELKKLEKPLQERIIAVIERARIRPENYFERLVGETAYKLRVGDYRILAEIDRGKLIILIIKIGHRKNIYK
ncbi:MAG: type II toxin-antitoxin system RelE/ParE family toxin [Candidatus Diapherotrites archaeon]